MIEKIIFFLKNLVLVGVKNAQDLEEFEKGSCWYYKDPSQKIQAALCGCGSVNLFLKIKAEEYCKQYMSCSFSAGL